MGVHPVVRKYYIFRALLKRFTSPILVVYALDCGLSIEQIGVVALAGSLASLLLEVPSGSIADTLGHRRALVISMLGQAVAMACYFGGTFPWILAATVLYFGFGTLMTGTSEALFYEQLTAHGLEKDHLRLYGQGKGFATAVSVASMALAGWFYTIAWYLPFIVGIAQFLVAACVAASFEQVPTKLFVSAHESYLDLLKNFRTATRTIWENKKLFWLVLSSALIIGSLFGTGDFQQAVLRDLGVSATWIGLIYAAKRLGGVFIQGYTHLLTKLVTAPLFITTCALLAATHYILAGGTSNPLIVLLGLIVGTASWVGLEVATNHYMNTFIPTGSRATTLSASNLLRDIVQFASIGIFTLLAPHVGNGYAYAFMGVILLVTASIPIIALFRAYKATPTIA